MFAIRARSRLLAIALGPAAVTLALLIAEAGADSTFTVTTTVLRCNAMDPSFPDPQLAGNPACSEGSGLSQSGDVTVTNDLPSSSLNFSRVVTFQPAAMTITDGDSIPPGTKLGGLRALTTLGLLNGACNSLNTVDFVLYNVALPDNPGDPRASTNIVHPRNDGQTNRFGAWQVGSPPPNGGPNNVTDADANNIADAGTLAVQNYPAYLLDAFDPDFVAGVGDNADGGANILPLVPHAVYGGLTNVLGNWAPLLFVQFDEGELTALPGSFSLMSASMGKPSVAVLGDPVATTAAPSAITDLCTPATTQVVLLGEDPSSTYTRVIGPAVAGTYFVVSVSASQRDLDQDGYENALDTCPATANSGWNPRAPLVGDGDDDGIGDACDANGVSVPDGDGDGFQNRQDNCPQAANGGALQTESEAASGPAADLGPSGDAIGDACDSEIGVINVSQNNSTMSITTSDSVGNGRYHVRVNVVAMCFGNPAADADGDGYCTAQDNAESGACAGTVPPSCTVRHTAWSGATHPALQMDSDGDLWSDAMESYLGTDGTKSCAQSSGANNESPLDNTPWDLNDGQQANTVDAGQMLPLNPAVNAHPKGTRADLNHDGIVNTIDVGRLLPLNKTCASAGIPPFSQQ